MPWKIECNSDGFMGADTGLEIACVSSHANLINPGEAAHSRSGRF